jgi:hypothetical protein
MLKRSISFAYIEIFFKYHSILFRGILHFGYFVINKILNLILCKTYSKTDKSDCTAEMING